MSRRVTLHAGMARFATLLFVATLLASLATVTTMATAPRHVFAGTASCNATYNGTSDRITVSFISPTIAGDGSGVYLDPTSGDFYTTASGAGDVGVAPATIDFVVTSGSFTGSDIWCVLVNGKPVGDKKGNNLDAVDVFQGSTALTGFSEGDEVCITAMISGADGKGGPKNKACFTVGRHTTTAPGASPTPTPTPSPTPTPAPTPTPTPCAADCPTPTPEPSVSAEVLGATAPPTDGLASASSSTVPALGVLLLILAAVLGTMAWFTPATKRIRR